MNTQVIYETGATSHAVNDLILFADNTRELAELRDKIYMEKINNPDYHLPSGFQVLYCKAVNQYKKEFPETDRRFFMPLGSPDAVEFCNLYAADFDTWKAEHGL